MLSNERWPLERACHLRSAIYQHPEHAAPRREEVTV